MGYGAVDVSLDGFFGDNGKGKVADYLVDNGDYSIVVAVNGGPNSGRSVVIDDQYFAMRQVPTGIHRPGVRCFIGQGTVVDPLLLDEELTELDTAGIDIDRLRVSAKAALITPWEKAFDQAIEKAKQVANGVDSMVGTTGKGIGPAYAHERYRIAFRVGDLCIPQTAMRLLHERQPIYERLFAGFGDLGVQMPSLLAMKHWMAQAGNIMRPLIFPTESIARDALLNGRHVLLDTHNGMGIGIKTGTYPNVTSSDMTVGGALAGAGISARGLRRVMLIIKAYATRVGNGPFPTELHDQTGEQLRKKGHEYGTVTNRARRCGWLDLVYPRFAIACNGVTDVVVTKVDPLSGLSELAVCNKYRYNNRSITNWDPFYRLEHCRPVFSRHVGWDEDITGIKAWSKLPPATKDYLRHIQKQLATPITMISTSPERDATIIMPDGITA